MIDTHCHLDEHAFETDRKEVIERALEHGVEAIVAVGTTLDSSRRTVDIANEFDSVFAAVGIHPNYASQAKPEDFDEVRKLIEKPNVVAVGETGLDRYWDYCPFEIQLDYFRKHIELSQATGKPFVVHCREADDDVVRELRSAGTGLRGVMHSFCGERETMEIALEHGLFISFAGMLTYKKNDDLRELAALVPRDRLMIETDAPYLSPEPVRGKRNESANVRHTCARLAEALGLSVAETDQLTTENARRLFSI